METNKSTENVTVTPADLYDEMAAETPPEPCEALQAAFTRARELLIHPR